MIKETNNIHCENTYFPLSGVEECCLSNGLLTRTLHMIAAVPFRIRAIFFVLRSARFRRRKRSRNNSISFVLTRSNRSWRSSSTLWCSPESQTPLVFPRTIAPNSKQNLPIRGDSATDETVVDDHFIKDGTIPWPFGRAGHCVASDDGKSIAFMFGGYASGE